MWDKKYDLWYCWKRISKPVFVLNASLGLELLFREQNVGIILKFVVVKKERNEDYLTIFLEKSSASPFR
jgi:hypothetical protein